MPLILMKEALFYKKLKKGKIVQCLLCPRYCVIANGQRGNCLVRENRNKKLISLVYGKPSSIALDPIEKKPLFHFLPGKETLSLGTAGCNLHCQFCQNWELSQCSPDKIKSIELMPEKIVKEAKKLDSKIISYTYSEPVVFYEYALDTSKLAHKSKMKNVLVSNGFINPEPMEKLSKYIDAANIDLKGRKDFYKNITGAWIEPVLETLKTLKKNKVWIEVTNLVIPTLNDFDEDFKWISEWIAVNLGKETPLHFSAFYPTYKLKNLPPTNLAKLKRAREIAMKSLDYVYVGNVNFKEGNNTYCPKCKKLVIEREGFSVIKNLLKNGRCLCGEKIAGVWKL